MAIKNAPRTFITIDGEETLVTNALMMERAIAALKAAGEPQEIVDKAVAHYTQLTKKSTTPKGESAAAKENRKLAKEVLKVMPQGDAVRTTWIMERVRFINSTQKCAKVMQVLIDDGKVVKVDKVDGRYIGYKLA